MRATEIVLHFDEREIEALQNALDCFSDESCTVEQKLREAFDSLYTEFVPPEMQNAIDTVCLCMDNDAAGQAANKRISDKLFIQGIKHEILVPEFKDWNEDLLCDEQEETECQTLQL